MCQGRREPNNYNKSSTNHKSITNAQSVMDSLNGHKANDEQDDKLNQKSCNPEINVALFPPRRNLQHTIGTLEEEYLFEINSP
jgi:hypothetical protein